MNFLAHGYRCLRLAEHRRTDGGAWERPYFVAGAAVPDWLNVVDRRIRARSRSAEPFLDDDRETMREIAAGVQQHHADDREFHRHATFHTLSIQFSVAAAELLPDDEGFRPSFLGHILVELLLDAELFRREPNLLDEYYATLHEVHAELVAEHISEMTNKDASKLSAVVSRFREARFLADYATDAGLLARLNGVMLRVGLPLLPDRLMSLLAKARQEVRQVADELISLDD